MSLLATLSVWAAVCMMLSSVHAISYRNGVMEATYSEMLDFVHDGDFRYLKEPVVITNSPMKSWTLFSDLDEIVPDSYEVDCKQQITDCDCFNGDPLVCEQFASSFIYTNDVNGYERWTPFLGTNELSYPFMQCMEITTGSVSVKHANEIIRSSNVSSFDAQHPNVDAYNPQIYDEHSHQYNKMYSYFRVLDMRNGYDDVSLGTMQLNVLDRISLSPFFKLFGLNGYQDLNDIHVWFGTQYYRAVRHYDKPNNVFFVLKGSRQFTLSPPHAGIYMMHPFGHESHRQQYPQYSVLQAHNDDDDEYAAEKAAKSMHAQTANYSRTYEVMLYENELLYLPGYWFHEVLNNNFTMAMSMWWNSQDEDYSNQVHDFHLPYNPDADTMTVSLLDEFLYFLQRLSEKWQQTVFEQYGENKQYMDTLYVLQSTQSEGYGFLKRKFVKLFPVVDGFSYETFEWYDILLHFDDILKCGRTRVEDYGSLQQFKQDLYFCFDFEDDADNLLHNDWDAAADELVRMHLNYGDIGISDLQLIEYLEHILLKLSGDASLIPIWIGFMNI